MYKTIVVHVDGGARQHSRLRTAARLAQEHDAHLVGTATTGMSWRAFVLLATSMGGPVMLDSDFQALKDAARERLDAFVTEASRLGAASVEAHLVEDDPLYAMLMQSRYADLTVLSRDTTPDPGLPERVRGLPQHVALHGAHPVLVVPETYEGQALPGTAVIGWDGSMQAIRAITGALPMLRRAEDVKLALINPDTLTGLHGEEPGADIALHLARHGVKVEVIVERTHSTDGDALLSLARACGADLLVTGAFGHSRYREWILGGVTRELLERTPIPLLLAH